MQEIGGYLGLEQFDGHEKYAKLVAVNSGRNALLYILRAREINKIYIPFFLCDSVSALCDKYHYQYEYYHINNQFEPIFDKELKPNEYLYIVNYYGILDADKLRCFKALYTNIIVDNVQAFFSEPIDEIDAVYSCRKFFGVPDGGYAATKAKPFEHYDVDVSGARMKHILGRYEQSASAFYADFKANDAEFGQMPLRYMSKLTHNLMSGINYEKVKKTRENNFQYLHNQLGAFNRLQITEIAGPYVYPFYMEDGMRIKRMLADEKIFVPTLWPNVLTLENTLEKDFAENILPLPIDQRYGMREMQFVVNEVGRCINRCNETANL
ncbi:MAG: hypothetical protein RR764_02330 [Oscillospiraceae bacterium]